MALRRSPRNRTPSPATPISLLGKRESSSSKSRSSSRSTRRCDREPERCISDTTFQYSFHMDEAECDKSFCYNAVCTNSSSSSAFIDFFATNTSSAEAKLVYGIDCEWQPIWFRAPGQIERVCTIQLFSPYTNTALVFSAVEYQRLPSALEDFLNNENIIKVGVNVIGDASRIARDFNCAVRSVYNVAKGGDSGVGYHQGSSMESLISFYCKPVCKYYVNKESSKGVRLSDWGKFPLSDTQIRYASLDAVLSFAIFYHQRCGKRGVKENCYIWDDKATFTICRNDQIEVENAYSEDQMDNREQLQPSSKVVDAKSNDFFKMMRNRSVEPPNKGKKSYPEGPRDALKGVNIVISGVLDSMTREQMTEFVIKHGGKVSKSITKSLTHLVNDVDGTVGESKLRECKARNIPIVGEDHILDLVTMKLG